MRNADQLPLFLEPNGNSRKSKATAGIVECPPGAERLLAELIQRGLSEGDLRVAARLCLLLDEGER